MNTGRAGFQTTKVANAHGYYDDRRRKGKANNIGSFGRLVGRERDS